VTVPPRLDGLPIATTHSPSRSRSPNETEVSGMIRLHPQQREVDLGVAPSLSMTVTSSAMTMPEKSESRITRPVSLARRPVSQACIELTAVQHALAR
jgi:hypothetical protein